MTISYSFEVFKAQIILFFNNHAPCLLCGKVHPIRIHMYFYRKIRIGEHNNEIKSFSIYCENAKQEGKQYTKRMLPFFVTPECNITFSSVIEYISLFPDGTIDYNQACYILGTYDNRTIRKHIAFGWKIIKMTVCIQLEILSSFPGFSFFRLKKPEENYWDYLNNLTQTIKQGNIRIGNIMGSESQLNLYLHIVLWFKKSRNILSAPLNHVLNKLPYYDTS